MRMQKCQVSGVEAAFRGMRNAMNSWDRADTVYTPDGSFINGENDKKLILNLVKSGRSHRKFLRMIHVQMDVTAPLYWWRDYDSYKVATVANGCSTMHKIHDKPFALDQFSYDALDEIGMVQLNMTIEVLNYYRDVFIKSGKKDKNAWRSMIQLLPNSYLQLRTIDLNYETVLSIILDRRNHKLEEFKLFTNYLCVQLPMMSDIVQCYDRRKNGMED